MSRFIRDIQLEPIEDTNIHMSRQTLKTLLHRFKEADILMYVIILVGLMSSGSLLLMKVLSKHPVSHKYRVRTAGVRWLLSALILTAMLFIFQIFLWRMYHIFMENHLESFLTYGQEWSIWRGLGQKWIWALSISAVVSFLFMGYINHWGRDKDHHSSSSKHPVHLRQVPPTFIQKHLDLMWRDMQNNTTSDPCTDNNDDN